MTHDKSREIHQQIQSVKNETLLILLTEGIVSIIEPFIPTRYCAPHLSGHKIMPELLRDNTILTGEFDYEIRGIMVYVNICHYGKKECMDLR